MTGGPRTAIFSIHDVAPQTLEQVAELRQMIAAYAGPVPISLLVVPRYHGADWWHETARSWIEDAAGGGDEIVLHGYEHRSPDGRDGAEFLRGMPEPCVRSRLERGLARLVDLGLRPVGFIAPAYAHPAALGRALRALPVGWWATRTEVYAGGTRVRLWSLGLGTSTAWRRATSPTAARLALRVASPAAALRLDLHPADLGSSSLRNTARALITGLLEQDRRVTTHGVLVRSCSGPPPAWHPPAHRRPDRARG